MLRGVCGKVFGINAGGAFGCNMMRNAVIRNFSVESKSNRYVVDRAIDSEIKIMEFMPLRPAIPSDSPFEVSDDRPFFNGDVYLRRKRNELVLDDGEEIDIWVPDKYQVGRDISEVCVTVNISKGFVGKEGKFMKKYLGFSLIASREDEIQIDDLFFLKNTYPNGNDLRCFHQSRIRKIIPRPESELQFALREFLEMRGIGKSITGFLQDYREWKSKLEDIRTWKTVEQAAKMDHPNSVDTLKKLNQFMQAW